MAAHSSILAWKIPWTEEPGRLRSMGSLTVGHDRATLLSFFTFMHWRRKWQPTPVFCLENPRDKGASWAAVYGVAQSRTRLKWLSSSLAAATRILGSDLPVAPLVTVTSLTLIPGDLSSSLERDQALRQNTEWEHQTASRGPSGKASPCGDALLPISPAGQPARRTHTTLAFQKRTPRFKMKRRSFA